MPACAAESDPGRANRSSLAPRRITESGLIWIKERPANAISIVRYSMLASPEWRIP
jgi:hypothetical protein